ncbi:SIMPL domain-containing protein [Ramlibacter sp. MAHUQ-53]|uniref:SIMPL domain-containing protein n=1 Tax=unclassified Ramlibacter TaxID=2617605 RepID=UPI003634F53E
MAKQLLRVIAIAAAMALGPAASWAGPELHLEAQARSLVDNDLMAVTLGVEHEGPRTQEPTQRVLAALQSAAARARAVPGIEVRLGSVNTQPVWGPKGRTGQWVVRGSVTLTSTQQAALGQLASELASELQVHGVHFSLSRARSDEVEAQLMTEVAAAFRRKAQAMAGALGFKDYAVKAVTLSQAGGAVPPRPVAVQRAAAAAVDAAVVPIPAEGGRTEVVLTLGGAVELR